tara:strand:- start:2354 stop:3013 length:660 start_codon:yes stop_codon:yes gene_type:complete
MGKEIDLMVNYPRSKRDVKDRGIKKTPKDQKLARKFSKEFFDGDRSHGYGGFSYNPRFWEPVIPTFKNYYSLDQNSEVLDVGCAKGFMLYDLSRLIPGINVKGIDISDYAIVNCIEEMKNNLEVGDAKELNFENDSFDLVISITTIHNLEYDECIKALKEINRVSKKNAFITVDAYRNDEEKKRMYEWNLTARTILHVDEWKELFDKAEYRGDYYWFIP